MEDKGFAFSIIVIIAFFLVLLATFGEPTALQITVQSELDTVKSTAFVLRRALHSVRQRVIQSGGGPIDNLVVSADTPQRTLDINHWGFPVKSWQPYETQPRITNTADCLSLWRVLLTQGPTVSTSTSVIRSVYQARFFYPEQCEYRYNSAPQYAIFYDSRDGAITVHRQHKSPD